MIMMRKSSCHLSIGDIREIIKKETITKKEMCQVIADWWIDRGLQHAPSVDDVYETARGNMNKLIGIYRDAKSYWLKELGEEDFQVRETTSYDELENGTIIRDRDQVSYLYFNREFQKLKGQTNHR